MIRKTKIICKSYMSISDGRGKNILDDFNSIKIFIEGKLYECEYEEWSFKDGYKMNGGHRTFWVTGEDSKKRELSRGEFNIVFGKDSIPEDYVDILDNKINKIIK